MNVAIGAPWTTASFLAWEDKQPLRHEFNGVRPVAMAEVTAAHAAIQRNIIFALGTRLQGKPCQLYGSSLKIEAAGRIRYPDAFVVCTPVPPTAKLVTDPVVVFEILNDSSSHTDLMIKNAEYRATSSIQRYVVLHQTHIGALTFTRAATGWTNDVLFGDDALLKLPEIGCEISIAEFYIGLELPPLEDNLQ